MAESGRKWAVGCCSGCALSVLLLIGLAGAGYWGVKRLTQRVEQLGQGMQEISERHGRIVDYHPEADGRIPPQRMDAFLEVRKTTAPERAKLEESLESLGETGNTPSTTQPGKILQVMGSGFGLVPRMMTYLSARNQALLSVDMGLGEYLYIYSLAYYSWLGRSPLDGPPDEVITMNSRRWSDDGDRGHGRDQIRIILNRQLLQMLRNQLEAVESDPRAGQLASWSQVLVTEVEAMEADPSRLPWLDGLPEELATSFAPYRERLEQSYCALCNLIEIAAGQT
jgi:hypothetical protein